MPSFFAFRYKIPKNVGIKSVEPANFWQNLNIRQNLLIASLYRIFRKKDREF